MAADFFATSQTVYLFLSRLTGGTARIYFLPPYAAAGIRTHVSRTCTTFVGPFRTALLTELPRLRQKMILLSLDFGVILCLFTLRLFSQDQLKELQNAKRRRCQIY